MLGEIYDAVMSKIATMQNWAASLNHAICPKILSKLEKTTEQLKYWKASRARNGCHSGNIG